MNNTVRSYSIDAETVEAVLKRHKPWYQRNKSGDLRYFAVCAKCENPIQLVNVMGLLNNERAQYGRHENRRVSGFDFFDGDMLRTCPYLAENQNPRRDDRRPMSETSHRIIQIAVENFDHIVRVLRKCMGINFSKNVAEVMLNGWFDAQGYNYNGANLDNIPWMIAYFAPSTSLYGQYLTDQQLVQAIKENVAQAALSDSDQLLRANGQPPFDLRFTTLKHRITQEANIDFEESLTLTIDDFTNSSSPVDARLVYQKELRIQPAEFESLMLQPDIKAQRNDELLNMASQILARQNFHVRPSIY